ncbi:tubulin glycylase 3C-like isoform X1 [Cimex lectularius]|uniref:Tubulin glycylase 3A n=1 Tax=Cimex lectularius TaxID=79782 RepID=A0A8I6SA10_CIMLE|nr:tubulin glycylase 3C-like isoform X1 [Cimex lectularius]
MADAKRAVGGNKGGNRKKLKTFHKKGAVKKKISSSKGASKIKASSVAGRTNQKIKLPSSNKKKISKGIINNASERKSLNMSVNCNEDNKPIEVLMAALATMPSLNVDELLKHYIAAKDVEPQNSVDNIDIPDVPEGRKTYGKGKKVSIKSKRIIAKKKTKTPVGIKVDKAHVKPQNAEDGAKLGASGKTQPKIASKKSQILQKPPSDQTKENMGEVNEEKSAEENSPNATEEKEEQETSPSPNVVISQSVQTVQKPTVTTVDAGEETLDLTSILDKNQNNASPVFHMDRTQSPSNARLPDKSKDVKKPGEIACHESNDSEKKCDTLIGMYLRKQEQIEKEFQSICQFVNRKRYNQLRLMADEALKNETTFALCCHSNGFQSVKKFFHARGWTERFANPDEKPLQYNNLMPAPDNESLVLSKLISRMPVKFIWAEGLINWSNIATSTIVNKFPYCSRSISTKTGLLQYLQSQHWTYSANFAYVKYPRTVSITNEDDMKYFATQYRISACVSMLKHFVEAYDEKRELVADHGVIPIECMDFAIQRVCEFVTFEEGTDVDQWNISMVTEDDWILFLLRFLDVAHFNAKYKNTCDYDIHKLAESARKCVTRVRDFWSDIDHEGVKNLWIVKPGASSCGRGIRIFKSLVEIANHCKPGFSYIAQKYIERPMIIHKTKFDIRQWFLVTSIQPMVVYMYDLCYLRFCSKEFSLVNLHESVHLSNNSVQCRYQNVSTRCGELPSDNMWDSDQFLSYLRGRKEDDKWFAITLPGMRKGIVGALLASQEGMVHRANCFNLYGADFMLTEDFVPWLIEINAGPCLRSTTSVTARLCPMVIEDTLNLALKKKNVNGALDCGHFRLVYSQKVFPSSINHKSDISISGKRAKIFMSRGSVQNTGRQGSTILKDGFEDTDSPLTYESRSLNYEKLSSKFKGHVKVETKVTLAPHANHHSPLGPGSILSRFDVSYKPNLLAQYYSANIMAPLKHPDSLQSPNSTDSAMNSPSAFTTITTISKTLPSLTAVDTSTMIESNNSLTYQCANEENSRFSQPTNISALSTNMWMLEKKCN